MHTLTQFWRWRHGDSVCSSVNEMRSSNKLQELNILKSKSYLQNNSTLQSVARRIIFWKFCGENMLTSSIYSAGISLHLLLWKLTDAVFLYKITNLKTIYPTILSRHNIWFRGHLSLVSDSCYMMTIPWKVQTLMIFDKLKLVESWVIVLLHLFTQFFCSSSPFILMYNMMNV